MFEKLLGKKIWINTRSAEDEPDIVIDHDASVTLLEVTPWGLWVGEGDVYIAPIFLPWPCVVNLGPA